MKILRREEPGYVLFDGDTMGFAWSEERPAAFDAEAPAQPPYGDLLSAPLSVYFEITRTCQLACRHCFTSSSPKAPGGFPLAKVRTILDDLRASGVINVRFTGGELTVHPDWREILAYAKDLGFVVSLQSNGAYRPEDTDAIVGTYRRLAIDQISFSIDGHEAAHDFLRGKGSYAKTLATLRAMGANGLPARINTILTPKNVASVDALFADIAPYCDVINIFQSRPIGRGNKGEYALTTANLQNLKGKLAEWRAKYPKIRFVFSGFPTPMKKDAVPFRMPRNYGFYALTISYDGRVWPHHYSAYQGDTFCLGRVPEERLLDIWRKSANLARFRDWIERLDRFCGACAHYGKDCPGIDFEIEHLFQTGEAEANPYCVHPDPRPRF